MVANGVEKYENVRYDIRMDELVISYEEPRSRPVTAFRGVKFTIQDTVFLKHLNEDARQVLLRYGRIWKCTPFANKRRFFLNPLHPKLQGKYKGTTTAKNCTTFQITFLKVDEPSFVCMAVHPFLDLSDFHWKEFE